MMCRPPLLSRGAGSGGGVLAVALSRGDCAWGRDRALLRASARDKPALAALKPLSLGCAQLGGGSAYLLRGVNDTQAVAVLEEAQHRGEDGEDQCSREVLGEEAENSLIPVQTPART